MNLDPRKLIKTSPTFNDCYVGVDLGQKHDYAVVSVVKKKNRNIRFNHLKRFRNITLD